MSKGRGRFGPILAAILMLLGMGTGVYATLQSNLTLSGTLQTSKVEIELNQPRIETEHVTPGQEISFAPTVTANGADCYVRLSVEIPNQSKTSDPLTIADLQPSAGWIWKGNVLYATKPLKHGESRKAIKGMVVPASWTEETASNIQINLTADAIQQAHFKPDFTRDAPWGTVEIKEHKTEDQTSEQTARKGKPEAITYVGNGLFEVPSGDLFANIPALLPGDQISDSITIQNGTDQPIELYFASVPQKDALLDEIGMKLSIGGTPFYDGTLDGEGLESERVLTTLGAGERTELEYEIHLPRDFENKFSLEADLLTWKIRAEGPDQAVQTGDEGSMYLLSALLFLSGAVLLVVHRKRKEDQFV